MIGVCMIEVKISKDSVSIEGHAEYADPGTDIVCASVSTIMQLCQMGLRILANQYPLNVKIIEVKDEGI